MAAATQTSRTEHLLALMAKGEALKVLIQT